MIHLDAKLGKTIGISCLIAWSLSASAQMYVNREWVETTGVPDNLDWTASTFDALGNVIVVGNTLVAPNNPDVLITKYDPTGAVLWQHTFAGGAGGQDYGAAVKADASGNCFVAAAVTGVGTDFDMAVLKYDANGSLLWSTVWNGPNNLADAPSCISFDANGNIFIAGSTFATEANPNYALVKMNAGGTVVWSASYDYAGFADVATGIEFDQANNPVITGGSATSINAWDYATVKYNNVSGAQTAVNRVSIPGVGLDNALAFTQDNAGSLFITGYRETAGNRDIQTIKLTSTLGLAWVKNYVGQGLEDVGTSVGGDNNGNVYITGYTRKTNGGSDFITIKYGPTGDVLWKKRYQARNDAWTAEAYKLVVTNDGGVLVAGTVFDGTSRNFMTVKYSADGQLKWEKEFDGMNGDDKALDIVADNVGNVYVSGVKGNGPTAEYATVKYSYLMKDNGIVLDTIGNPFCMDNELIVKFRPNVVNTAVVDNKGWEFGDLAKVIGTDRYAQITAKLGLPSGSKPLKTFKIFRRLTTADSLSTSRLGEAVPMYEHWSAFLVGIPDPMDLNAAKDSMNTIPGVIEYADLIHLYQLADVPNDPLLDIQHGLIPHALFTAGSINCEPAWEIQAGQPYIRVGILDHPVYWGHEEFGDGTFSGSKIKDGWDYANNVHISNISSPAYSHGTACAGIIGAFSNNHTGISGVAGGNVDEDGNPGVALISLGTFDDNDNVVAEEFIANAIVEASTDVNGDYGYGCHILNNSYYRYGSEHAIMKSAIRTCWQNNCVFVACRGNDETSMPAYPAGCGDDDWVISVGASGMDGSYKRVADDNGEEFWWASDYGDEMDIIAPGVYRLVISTEAPDDPLEDEEPVDPGYGRFNGTSAAAPIVVGIAALLESEHNIYNGTWNNLSGEDVEHLIERTANDIYGTYGIPPYEYEYPVGYDDHNGWGRVNAGAAVQAIAQPYYRVVHSGTPVSSQNSAYPTQSVTITGNAGDLENGTYNAVRVEVVHTYQDQFSTTTQIIDGWKRSSSASGYPAGSTIDGTNGAWGTYDFTIQGNNATVVATTNCWHILTDAGNNPIDQWIPAPPNAVRTAYSLYVLYGEDVGVPTQDAEAGGLHLFPSPVDDVLHVQYDLDLGDRGELKIIDLDGRVVRDEPLSYSNSDVSTIPVANLGQGVYLVQLISEKGSLVNKFIKN